MYVNVHFLVVKHHFVYVRFLNHHVHYEAKINNKDGFALNFKLEYENYHASKFCLFPVTDGDPDSCSLGHVLAKNILRKYMSKTSKGSLITRKTLMSKYRV